MRLKSHKVHLPRHWFLIKCKDAAFIIPTLEKKWAWERQLAVNFDPGRVLCYVISSQRDVYWMHLYFKHAQRKVYKMCTRHNFYILSEPRHRLPWPIKHHSIIWKGNQTMRCSKEVKRERGASWNVSSVQSLFHLKRAFLKFNTNNSGFWSTEFISLNHKLCLHCIVKERSAKYVYWTSAGGKKREKNIKRMF